MLGNRTICRGGGGKGKVSRGKEEGGGEGRIGNFFTWLTPTLSNNPWILSCFIWKSKEIWECIGFSLGTSHKLAVYHMTLKLQKRRTVFFLIPEDWNVWPNHLQIYFLWKHAPSFMRGPCVSVHPQPPEGSSPVHWKLMDGDNICLVVSSNSGPAPSHAV